MKQSARMEGQVGPLIEAYDGLRALRTVLGSAPNCLGLETVVPSRFLSELLVAAPVWYIEPKVKRREEGRGSGSRVVRYFCDLGQTNQFAYLFQIYNSRVRYFSEYTSDIMPLPLVKLVAKVKDDLFDYLVIATPYHDYAFDEGGGGKYRIPEPDRSFPFWVFETRSGSLMFFLGRWSGTGLFPAVAEMIAGTIEHLGKSKEKLVDFGGRFGWYMADDKTYDVQKAVYGPRLRPIEAYQFPKENCPRVRIERERWKRESNSLVRFADTVCQQFEDGSLFSWLRGESQPSRWVNIT